jgi:thiamine biosynthesis lipoprotein
LNLTNVGVSTSGNYSQFYEIAGQRFSKIINPATGYPDLNAASATVIAPDCTTADALSTALCVLGGLKGIEFIDSLGEEFGAVIMEKDKDKMKIYESSRYPSFLLRRIDRDRLF